MSIADHHNAIASVTGKHLHRYTGEFDFRYNSRKMTDGERTVLVIEQVAGKRCVGSDRCATVEE